MVSSLLRQKNNSGDTVALVLAAFGMRYSNEAGITEPSVYLLRHISEIRDKWISAHSWGQSAVDNYYRGRGLSLELRFERNWMVVGIGVEGIAAVFCWLILGSISQRRKIGSALWERARV